MAIGNAPCKGKSFMYCLGVLKLLPLQGDNLASITTPGRCPGLRASALSGRAVGEFLPFTFSLRLVTIGSGRAVGELLPFTFSLRPVTVGSGRAVGELLDLLGVPTVQVETYCSIQVITHYCLGNRVVAFDPEKTEYTQTKKTFAFLFFCN